MAASSTGEREQSTERNTTGNSGGNDWVNDPAYTANHQSVTRSWARSALLPLKPNDDGGATRLVQQPRIAVSLYHNPYIYATNFLCT